MPPLLSVQKRRNVDGRQILSDANMAPNQDLELMNALNRLDKKLPRNVSAEEPLTSLQQATADSNLADVTATLDQTQVEFARAATAESGFIGGHTQNHEHNTAQF